MFSAKFFLTIYVRIKLGNPVTVIISKLHLVDVLRPNATAIYLQTITMMVGKKQGHRLIHTHIFHVFIQLLSPPPPPFLAATHS